ncbi:hypothetical protein [uncultured Anaerovibrio sp.]|uniref:hypothetical protein n=1 Tax=uncultured Anaerovibrio sp. TaxID=361586 RepID=UPI0026217308|nr:hypothetical protein [uncultured Anaerovibrio sp.]
MEEENALPHGWENMAYDAFLIERRKLMAAKIKQAKHRYPHPWSTGHLLLLYQAHDHGNHQHNDFDMNKSHN